MVRAPRERPRARAPRDRRARDRHPRTHSAAISPPLPPTHTPPAPRHFSTLFDACRAAVKHVLARGCLTRRYALAVRRRADGSTTVVHRRFKEFAELEEAVNASLAGHHMQSSLPRLPTKQLKLLTDHRDAAFIESRRRELATFARRLVAVPHAASAPSMLPFVGLASRVREHSHVFREITLGFVLAKSAERDFPAVVESVRPGGAACALAGEGAPQIAVGDLISKISGRPTSTMSFRDVVDAIKFSQRPIMLHFLATTHPTAADNVGASASAAAAAVAPAVTVAAGGDVLPAAAPAAPPPMVPLGPGGLPLGMAGLPPPPPASLPPQHVGAAGGAAPYLPPGGPGDFARGGSALMTGTDDFGSGHDDLFGSGQFDAPPPAPVAR